MTNPQLVLNPRTQFVTVEDASPTVSVRWDRVVQNAVINTGVGPTIASRAYAIMHTAMYDAWSAYSTDAVSTQTGDSLQRPASEHTDANKTEAMSFAAYRVLLELFPEAETSLLFDNLMTELGFNTGNKTVDPSTAAGIGNLSAEALMAFRRTDGSNQINGYEDTTGYEPVNKDVDSIQNLEKWTPETIPIPSAGSSANTSSRMQMFLTPQWSVVTPFALESSSALRPEAPEPFLLVDAFVDLESRTITLAGEREARVITADMVGKAGEPGKFINQRFIDQAERVVRASAALTDIQKLIAEFWEDAGGTSFPPGTWHTFGEYVSARDSHSLDEDALMFLSLSNAIFDAGVATWEAKVFYNYVRPIRAIRELGMLGLLNDGTVGKDEITGEEGFVIEAWGGSAQGTRTILANNFLTYQTPDGDPSPPFAEYTSGHSSFSAAGAEILKRFTGEDDFGSSITFDIGTSRFENLFTPKEEITLSWDTFTEAADEAGLSRIYGGIHFEDGDLNGRALGRQVAESAWNKVQDLANGADVVTLDFTADEFSADSEVGCFVVDDTNGTMDGLSPDDAGYLAVAMARSSVLFSALPEDADVEARFEAISTRSFLQGSYVRFFSISAGTVDTFLHTGSGQVSLSGIERIDETSRLELTLADLNMTASLAESTGIGTGLQGSASAEVLDLTKLEAATEATFTVQREAAFNNVVGFYLIDDLTGRVIDSEGNVFDPENTTDYVQAALANRITELSLSSLNNGVSTFSTTLEAGQILAPFIVVDGTIDELIDEDASNDPAIYTPFLGANLDSADHVRLFGNNTFGFEDLVSGGDQDFDDLIVQVDFL
ncbi:hypothetical protein S7335_1099 [Synechococcus sp. PCC 7335]|uniref:DUF6851 domain-containing protein n=1 Tax=Synechococcus sp. (strain ATCC 29403 / PCC 7335) TaxID=91464 RepID=UPI00017EDA00|nr:DUF4114 domain-containing protein [Synechococcus sp. PCC 7335]EDX82796.1 hypothetical protein S7335_1099 [Synechococcus sp. PCC 7335]